MKELTSRNKPFFDIKEFEDEKRTAFIITINNLDDGELFGCTSIIYDIQEKLGMDHEVKDVMKLTVNKLLDGMFKELVKRGYIKEK